MDNKTTPKVGDSISLPIMIRPKWWQFWCKPRLEQRQFVVTGASHWSEPPAPRCDVKGAFIEGQTDAE